MDFADAMRWAPDMPNLDEPTPCCECGHYHDGYTPDPASPCGHYHDGECPDPGTPCGDYRCCIN